MLVRDFTISVDNTSTFSISLSLSLSLSFSLSLAVPSCPREVIYSPLVYISQAFSHLPPSPQDLLSLSHFFHPKNCYYNVVGRLSSLSASKYHGLWKSKFYGCVVAHTGSVSTANGSALVRFGDTLVVCGVKAVSYIYTPLIKDYKKRDILSLINHPCCLGYKGKVGYTSLYTLHSPIMFPAVIFHTMSCRS